jgi:hypothetical protein
MENQNPVGFTPKDAGRIARVTQIVERQYRNTLSGGIRPPQSFAAIKCAKTGNGGIPAMSGTTPGTGSITISDYIGGSLVARTTTDTACNDMPAPIAPNVEIKVAQIDGAWFVINEACTS